MWSYYGSKGNIIQHYPAPNFNKIIEPFAGTAKYALKYFDHDVLLVDKYDVITRIWQWLQKCSPNDVLSLPRLKFGETVDQYNFDCIEAKWFVGMIIVGAPTQPKKTASKWKTVIRPNTQNYKLQFAADNLWKIRHWEIRQGDYVDIANEQATWFIDPPYQNGGKYYVHSKIDYGYLAQWSQSRMGDVIVCENTKADWLPFTPLVKMHGNKYTTTEAIFMRSNS
jgi:site-specific DNA-adenine methylase